MTYDMRLFGLFCLIFGIAIGLLIGLKVPLIVDEIRKRFNTTESNDEK